MNSRLWKVGALTGLLWAASYGRTEAGPAATALFEQCVASVEGRQIRSPDAERIVAGTADSAIQARLHRGDLVIEDLGKTEATTTHGGLLHHWRGTAFAPRGTATDLDRVLRNIDTYPQVYAPEVERARLTGGDGDHLRITLRVRQKHVLTVVMDTAYDVTFGSTSRGKGWSASRSTRIAEIDAPGSAKERPLAPSEEHGFLWKQNIYWTWEERDGGLYMQIESVSLTRDIPAGLGWVVRPFVDAVPRDSLEFTLRRTREALGR